MSAAYLDIARAHAPLLMIITPLVGAALVLVSGPARMGWLVACLAVGLTALIAIDFALRVLAGVTQPVAEVGVMLHVDGAGVFAGALIALTATLIVLSAGSGLNDAGREPAPYALALLLCALAGWLGALMADDLFAVIAAVEAAWLSGLGLTALHGVRDRAGLNGALRMLVAGGVGAVLMLLGAALLARGAGSSALDALPLAQIRMENLAGAGAALLGLGLAIKAGVAPVHAWMSASVGRTTVMVTLGVGVLGVLGGLSVLARISAYTITAPQIGAAVSVALAALGAASIVVGSMQAVGASNFLRLASYAGVSQAGCVLLSLALGSPAGFAAALTQLAALAAAGLALYGGAAAGRVTSLTMLDGYAQRAPLASAAITAGALSLMGAPLTIGFLGRWRLVEAGVGAGWWWASGLVIIASLAGVFYGGRLIERMYFRRANAAYEGAGGVWRVALGPALIVAIIAIGVGVAPGSLLRAAAAASAMLTGISA